VRARARNTSNTSNAQTATKQQQNNNTTTTNNNKSLSWAVRVLLLLSPLLLQLLLLVLRSLLLLPRLMAVCAACICSYRSQLLCRLSRAVCRLREPTHIKMDTIDQTLLIFI
jgi:hypothetical protein